MAFQVKVEYGGKRFAAFLLENISYDGLVSSSIKKNCSSLAHLDADKIRLRYGYGERLSSRFFFLRSRRKGFVRRKKWKTTTTRKQSFNLKKNWLSVPAQNEASAALAWKIPATNFVVWNPNNCRIMHQLFRQHVSLKRRQRVPHQLEMPSKDVAL